MAPTARPSRDLPGLPMTLAILVSLVVLVAVPVACACYVVYQKLPALLAVRAGLGG